MKNNIGNIIGGTTNCCNCGKKLTKKFIPSGCVRHIGGYVIMGFCNFICNRDYMYRFKNGDNWIEDYGLKLYDDGEADTES